MFEFVKSTDLRKNLDITLKHILDLVLAAKDQRVSEVAKSSFRKTCIIHMASIIEALLFYHMECNVDDKDLVELEPKYTVKSLYTISETKDIIAGEREIITKKLNKKKLNLGQLQKILKKHNLITSELYKQVDKVRELRNHQHLSTQSVYREYNIKDQEYVISTLREVIEYVRKENNS